MNDTDMTTNINNAESEGSPAKDDGGIIDMEMTVPKSAGQETVSQLVTSIAAVTRPSISRQLAESIAAVTRPSISRQLAESIAAVTRPSISRQLAESIAAVTRPSISRQLAESIAAVTRPSISRQLAESIAAVTRPSISRQLAESIATVTRPSISRQLAESIAAVTRPSISRQLAESIAVNQSLVSKRLADFNAVNQSLVSKRLADFNAVNQSLVSKRLADFNAVNQSLVSKRLADFNAAIYWQFVNVRPIESFTALKFGTFPDLSLTRRVDTTREEHEIWSDSVVVEAEDHSTTGEKSYWLTQFDALVKDHGLRRSCRSLLADGYYALAVERAYIYIDNLVSKRSGRSDKDGADLMRAVFSPKNPVLKLNNLQSRSEENQQQGYMHIFEGTMIGIRNPRAHEYDLEDSPEEALEMLVIASHLIRMLNRATSV